MKIDILFFLFGFRFGNRYVRQCALLFTLYIHYLLASNFFFGEGRAKRHTRVACDDSNLLPKRRCQICTRYEQKMRIFDRNIYVKLWALNSLHHDFDWVLLWLCHGIICTRIRRWSKNERTWWRLEDDGDQNYVRYGAARHQWMNEE